MVAAAQWWITDSLRASSRYSGEAMSIVAASPSRHCMRVTRSQLAQLVVALLTEPMPARAYDARGESLARALRTTRGGTSSENHHEMVRAAVLMPVVLKTDQRTW